MLLVWFGPAALLLIALAPLPYSYYSLLRIIVCTAAIYLAMREWSRDNKLGGWLIGFAGIALLMNPLVPVHLTRAAWAWLNVGCATFFTVHWLYAEWKAK